MVKDGCSKWDAITKWTSEQYLVDQTKITQAKNFAHDMTAETNSQAELDTYLEELNYIKENGLPEFDFSNGMVHLQNLWLNRNDIMQKDYEVPKFIADIIQHEDSYLSYTSEENNAYLKQFAV